jgi:hypothetical protein
MFRPTLSGQTERFGGGRTVQPLWGQNVTLCKHLWVETLQERMVRVGVSHCLNEGWPNHPGTLPQTKRREYFDHDYMRIFSFLFFNYHICLLSKPWKFLTMYGTVNSQKLIYSAKYNVKLIIL